LQTLISINVYWGLNYNIQSCMFVNKPV
jgi:hypothetical protein